MTHLSLADRLKKLRTAKHYTQSYVSSQLHITRSSYSNYETGTRTPSLESLIKLAQFYNITMDSLTGLSVSRAHTVPLSNDELSLLDIYRALTLESQKEILSFAEFKKNSVKQQTLLHHE